MDKIIGIGNALVDILAVIEDDALLESMNLPKGSMQHDQCFGPSGSSSGIYR